MSALREMRSDPAYWFGLGAALTLMLLGQDQVPFLGTLAASLFTVFLFAHLHGPRWRERARPLSLLGLILFPVTGLWPILASLHANTGWFAPIAAWWSPPILFFMCLALWLASAAAARLTEPGTITLDKALRMAAGDFIGKSSTILILALGMSVMFAAALTEGTVLFFVVVPFGLALLKTTNSGEPTDPPR